MTRLIKRVLRARRTMPPFAVHFHSHEQGTVACWDERCGVPPLGTS